MTASGAHALALAQGHWGIAVLVALFTASIFLSTAACNILAGVLCIVAVIQWVRFRPLWLLRQPMALACIGFFAWLLVREALDGRLGSEALRSVNQFRPLLFLVLWAPLFVAERHRRAAVGATLAILALFFAVAVVGYAVAGHLFYTTYPYPWRAEAFGPLLAPFYSHSPDLAGPVLLVALFGTLQLALDHRRYRWLLVFTLAAAFVLFVATGRKSSQLVFLACGALFLFFQLRPASGAARVGWTLAAAVLAFGLAASPLVRSSAQRVWTDSVQALATPAEKRAEVSTSSGLRILFWQTAAQVVRASPWIGTSESRYHERYLAEAQAMGGMRDRHGNPHNEYLHVAGALGAIGLAIYLAIHVAAAARGARHPSATQRRILAIYLLAALLTALANSLVIDMVPGHFHALALLVLGWFAWDGGEAKEAA